MVEIENEDDREDIGELGHNPIQDRAKNILPIPHQEGNISRGEVEKLARFFSEMPSPEQAQNYFFGFLNQQQLFGFTNPQNAKILTLMLDRAAYSYMNSCPAWQWKREHTMLLENIKAMFMSIIYSSVGTKDNIQNARTALNELRIQRGYSDNSPQKKKFWQL